MKKIGVKKLAALAAGAVLVGTALAPFVSAAAADIAKGDVYQAGGAPAVNVVVGSSAMPSDGVVAGQIARAIALGAVTEVTPTCTVTGGGSVTTGQAVVSDISVDLRLGGTQTYENSKRYDAYLNSAASQKEFVATLGDSQLSTLTNESVSIKHNGTNKSLTMKERIGISLDAKMDVHDNLEDIMLEAEAGDLNYEAVWGISAFEVWGDASTNYFRDDQNDSVRVPFFGEKYLVQKIDLTSSDRNCLKLIKDKAKSTYTKGQTLTVDGKGDYAGRTLKVKVVDIVDTAEGSIYAAIFQLSDENGTILDEQSTGASTYVDFEDSEGNDIVDTDIYVDAVYASVGTNEGSVILLIGSSTVDLCHAWEYPYDTDEEDDDEWMVQFVYSGTGDSMLDKVAVKNNSLPYVYDEDNPWLPLNGGLTSPTDKRTEVSFPNEFASVLFEGWENERSKTPVEIGNDKLDMYLSDDTHMTDIFFSKKLTKGSKQNFKFDNTNHAYRYTKDANVMLFNGMKVNGLTVTIGNYGDGTNLYMLDDYGTHYTDANVTTTIKLGDLNRPIDSWIGSGSDVNNVYMVSHTFEMRKGTTNVDDTTASFADGLASDNNRFYLLSSMTPTSRTSINLEGSSSGNDDVNQFVAADESGNGWLLLGPNTWALQYSKSLKFTGTDYDETGTVNYACYWPHVDDFNDDRTSASIYVANFWVREGDEDNGTDYSIRVSIDTESGDTLDAADDDLSTAYNCDINYGWYTAGIISLNDQKYCLRDDTPATKYSKVYTDRGTVLEARTSTAYMLIPETKEQVAVVVKSKGASETTTGGEELLGIAEGDTVTSTAGTKITVTKVTYTKNVEGAGTASGDAQCTVSPGTVKTMAADITRGQVFKDTEAPSTKNVVVGGPAVNLLADPALKDKLTKEGDYEVYKDASGNVVVAGYTAADTEKAGLELVDVILGFV